MATKPHKPDPASEFHASYLAFCDDCQRSGIPELTPEEWVNLLESTIVDGNDEG